MESTIGRKRIHILQTLVLSLIVLALPISAQTFNEQELKGHLRLIMQWWPGEYDNHEQIVRRSAGSMTAPVYEPVFRIHSHSIQLDLPELGENILYVEEYLNADPTNISRIRIYKLIVDEPQQAIRIKLYSLKGGHEKFIGARLDPERLAKIKPSDLTPFSDSCDIYMRFEGGQFNGGMELESCGKDAWFEYQVVLGPDYNWTRDRQINRQTGEVHWNQTKDDNYTWIQMSKARTFACSVNHNPNGDMTKTEALTEIELHDQGGAVDVAWPDGRTLEFQLHTREFTSPSERKFPLFRILEKGEHVPIAYAYTVDDADRFGLNLGWFYVLCRLKSQGVPQP